MPNNREKTAKLDYTNFYLVVY